MVSDGGVRPRQNPLINIVIVSQGADAADDWIFEHANPRDIVVTNDIPLADRVIKQGASVLKHDGSRLTEDSIGMALATRNLMTDLRAAGEITGGGRSFSKNDRSRFLQALDTELQKR